MMESADFSDLNDSSPRTIVHRAQLGRVLLQRQMCSRAMIVDAKNPIGLSIVELAAFRLVASSGAAIMASDGSRPSDFAYVFMRLYASSPISEFSGMASYVATTMSISRISSLFFAPATSSMPVTMERDQSPIESR